MKDRLNDLDLRKAGEDMLGGQHAKIAVANVLRFLLIGY